MAQIVWIAEAQRWLQEIYDYIAKDNEAAAYRTVRGIHTRAEILLTFPEIGYRYRERPDIRVLLYGHYRIAYLCPIARGRPRRRRTALAGVRTRRSGRVLQERGADKTADEPATCVSVSVKSAATAGPQH